MVYRIEQGQGYQTKICLQANLLTRNKAVKYSLNEILNGKESRDEARTDKFKPAAVWKADLSPPWNAEMWGELPDVFLQQSKSFG